jgi:hypothetical protein
MKEIQRFQDSLLLIRRTVGWTAEEFGEKIGVTRQTINNLEGKKVPLSKTVYIAMRSVLDNEIKTYPNDTEMLLVILDIFVDSPEKYSDKQREELLAKANLMSPAILAKTTSRKTVSQEWLKTAGVILGTAIGIGAITIGAWLSKIWTNKK